MPHVLQWALMHSHLFASAGKALKDNITTLGPQVLPLSEKLVFVGNMLARKVLKLKWAPYIPDFQEATKHICIHTGGLQHWLTAESGGCTVKILCVEGAAVLLTPV
eukprot:GHUV01035389.1.p3 GENE.GHUV01035389.1~~GHUV01035389.1.p3  ORF type:complete len:106 (-),score=29.36 GHUV01035389.1:414-731(-)